MNRTDKTHLECDQCWTPGQQYGLEQRGASSTAVVDIPQRQRLHAA